MRDDLGDRLKDEFERPVRARLAGENTVIRLDGRAFHTYTRGLDRPFDETLSRDMVDAARVLCAEVSGARLAYTQSDEISLVVRNTGVSQPWFGGDQQKTVSVAASLVTAAFNRARPGRLATFDARAFSVSDAGVTDYLIWRQLDASRNSVSSAARAHFSHRALHGKTVREMKDMLREIDAPWHELDARFRHGVLVCPETRLENVTYVDRRTGLTRVAEGVTRRYWVDQVAPWFADEPRAIEQLVFG